MTATRVIKINRIDKDSYPNRDTTNAAKMAVGGVRTAKSGLSLYGGGEAYQSFHATTAVPKKDSLKVWGAFGSKRWRGGTL